MRRLHESVVKTEELDTLGHMNFRFYVERAHKANQILLESLGLDFAALKACGGKLTAVDTFNRFHHEQFPDAPLTVQGGVLHLNESSIVTYYEVVNSAKKETAATFIIEFALIDAATRAPFGLPSELAAAAGGALVAAPDYGLPRSLDLAPPRVSLTYREVADRLGDVDSPDMMNRAMERLVEPEDCDTHGYLFDEQEMMFSPRRMAQMTPGQTVGPPVFKTDDGHRFAWAWLETRTVRVAQPRGGDTLATIGADLSFAAKTRHSRRWTFNKTTGRVASLTDTIGIALDLDARRPINIPANVRAALEASHAPEFA